MAILFFNNLVVAYVWICENNKHIFAPSKGITFDVFNNYLNKQNEKVTKHSYRY